MSRCSNWSPLVERFQKRLSNWKSKLLSYGGRLTLLKSVLGNLGVYFFSIFKAPSTIIKKLESTRRKFFWGGNSDERKMAWIAWDTVIAPLNQGGLGIGSLKISNQAMLAKWWWRFLVDDIALWRKIIISIHGHCGGLRSVSSPSYKAGPWHHIIKLKEDLHTYGLNLESIFKRKVGNGQTTRFWLDPWIGGPLLRDSFPRLFRLESNSECMVIDRAPKPTAIPINFHSPNTSHAPHLSFFWAWSRPVRS